MQAAITSLQTEITSWAPMLQSSVMAIIVAFAVIGGIWLMTRLLMRAAKSIK